MRVKALRPTAYFLIALVFSLILSNVIIFYQLRNLALEVMYEQAYMHYTAYVLSNGAHRGDKNFVVSNEANYKSISFVFEDPFNPNKVLYVSVNPEYLERFLKKPIKLIVLSQVPLVFLLVFVYQLVVEKFLKRIEDQEQWIKALVASVAHKLGNFLATQKLNVALLKDKLKDENLIKRLERSISRIEKDMSLILQVLNEERSLNPEWVRGDALLLETLKDFEEELIQKKVILHVKEFYLYGDEADIKDILYNLVSNSVKYSKSFIHVKVCKRKGDVILIFRNDIYSLESKGMGIGLTLLRRVVNRQGGELNIRIKNHYTVFLRLRGR